MLEQIAAFLKKHNRWRMIRRERDGQNLDYLERFYIISTKWLGIYLHRFWIDDEDGIHNHPWHSISILLKGQYFEEQPLTSDYMGPTKIYSRRPLRPLFRFRHKNAAHRITLGNNVPGSCWSLFIRFGLKRQVWGFYRSGKFEPAAKQSRRDVAVMASND